MAKLDQEKTCHLHHAADMVKGLTDGIVKMDQVMACRGVVTAANLAENVSPTVQSEPKSGDCYTSVANLCTRCLLDFALDSADHASRLSRRV